MRKGLPNQPSRCARNAPGDRSTLSRGREGPDGETCPQHGTSRTPSTRRPAVTSVEQVEFRRQPWGEQPRDPRASRCLPPDQCGLCSIAHQPHGCLERGSHNRCNLTCRCASPTPMPPATCTNPLNSPPHARRCATRSRWPIASCSSRGGAHHLPAFSWKPCAGQGDGFLPHQCATNGVMFTDSNSPCRPRRRVSTPCILQFDGVCRGRLHAHPRRIAPGAEADLHPEPPARPA